MNRLSLTVPVGTSPNQINPGHRYRIHTGPTPVQVVAERLAKAYFHSTVVDTQHVYVVTSLGKSVLVRVLGETWTEHDIEELVGMR